MKVIMKKKYLNLLILFYLFSITIGMSFFIYYRSALVILVLLSFLLFGTFIILDYSQTNLIISFGILFNLFGLLYSNYYILENITNPSYLNNTVFFSYFLSIISMACFNIGYFSVPYLKNSFLKIEKINTKVVYLFLLFLFILSVLTEYYVIFIKIGFSSFFSSSRAHQSLLISQYSSLTFYKSFFIIIAICTLLFYLNFKEKKYLYLFIGCFIINIFNTYVSVSRAEIFTFLLPIIYLLYIYKKITTKQVIILALLFFILFGAWKSVISSFKQNGEIKKENVVLSFDSEFNSWYKISENILDSDHQFLYGKSYLETFYNLLIPITKSEPLSKWYVRNYEFDVYIKGGGRGFSGVLEAYLNFGLIGNIIVFFLYGVLFKKISNYNNEISMIIFLIVIGSVYQLFRSESYSLWKTMYWFKIIPILIIFKISKRRYL